MTYIHKLLKILLIINFIIISGCSPNQGKVIDTSMFLYKVSNHQGNYIYLLGTCHPGRDDIKSLDETTEKALSESDHIWLEVTFDDHKLAEYSEYLYKNSIEDVKLTKELNELKKIYPSLKNYQNLEKYNSVTISSLALNDIQNEIEANNDNSIDLYIYEYAKRKNNFKEIEGVEKQMMMIADISQNSSHYIIENLMNREQYILDNKNLLNAYYTGQVSYIENIKIINQTQFHDEALLYQNLLCDNRNIEMTDKIKEICKQNTIDFIGIGIRHLYGEKGIIQLLKADGYQVISMSYKNTGDTYEN